MADAIDEIYLRHLTEAELITQPIYTCTNGYLLEPRRALSGLVEHRCRRCSHVVEQPFAEYLAARSRGTLTTQCPRKTLRRKERRRRYG